MSQITPRKQQDRLKVRVDKESTKSQGVKGRAMNDAVFYILNEEILNAVLFRGYLGAYWIDFATLSLVCKTWSTTIRQNQRAIDARCLGVAGKSNGEVTLASCLLARVPPLPSLEWLELDYCFDNLSPARTKRKNYKAKRVNMKIKGASGYVLDEELELEPSARRLLVDVRSPIKGDSLPSSLDRAQSRCKSPLFWPNLRCLSLRGVKFPLDDSDAYVISTCCSENLEVLDLSRVSPVKGDGDPCLRDYGAVRLSRCCNLRFLDLSMNNHIGDEALYHICVSCNQLRALGLAGCQGVSAQGVHFIRKMLWKTLEVLDISSLTSVTDDSLTAFATGRLAPMAIMSGKHGLPREPESDACGDWKYSSPTPHPGWVSLWCLMCSFLPNVIESATVTALLGMGKATPSGQPKPGSTALKILECRGLRRGEHFVDNDVYVAAKRREVACLLRHADQSDLVGDYDRVANLNVEDGDLSRIEKVWPPSMLAFRPSYDKDQFYH